MTNKNEYDELILKCNGMRDENELRYLLAQTSAFIDHPNSPFEVAIFCAGVYAALTYAAQFTGHEKFIKDSKIPSIEQFFTGKTVMPDDESELKQLFECFGIDKTWYQNKLRNDLTFHTEKDCSDTTPISQAIALTESI